MTYSIPKSQVIVCAAIKQGNRIICGIRHYDKIMRQQIDNSKEGAEFWNHAEQGFVDNRLNFLTRIQAFEIAEKNGQLKNKIRSSSKSLFSEELY